MAARGMHLERRRHHRADAVIPPPAAGASDGLKAGIVPEGRSHDLDHAPVVLRRDIDDQIGDLRGGGHQTGVGAFP